MCHSLNVPELCFHIWCNDGSFEPKYAAEFLILTTIYIVVLLTGINFCNNNNKGGPVGWGKVIYTRDQKCTRNSVWKTDR